MRVLLAVLLAVAITAPVCAQEAESDALLFLDVGPGFFKSLSEDTTSAEVFGVSTYAGLGIYASDKLALATRVYVTQDGQKSTVTSLWGYAMYFPTASAGKNGPYLSFGVGTEFDGLLMGGKGGYQLALFSEDILMFCEAEGRVVNQDEINTMAFGNVGLRASWGRR